MKKKDDKSMKTQNDRFTFKLDLMALVLHKFNGKTKTSST